MREKEAGTARFAALVKAAGQPHAVTLWTEPEEDAEFMKAVRGKRVLSVHQENVGQRKDYGEVSFNKEARGTYLVFPKSLEEFEGKRVVGIRYDLLAEAPARGPIAVTRTKPAKRPARAVREKPVPAAKAEPPPKPEPKPEPRFEVTVERVATLITRLEVTAPSAAVAKKLALAQAGEKPFEVTGATVRTRATRIRKSNH